MSCLSLKSSVAWQVNFFQFIANEIRAELASLGLKSLDELTGRTDLLKQRELSLGKTSGLDLSFLTKFVGGNKLYKDRVGMEVGHSASFHFDAAHSVHREFIQISRQLTP